MSKKYRILIWTLSLVAVLSVSMVVALFVGGADENSIIRLVSYDYIENYLLGYIDGKDTGMSNQLAVQSGKLAEAEADLSAAQTVIDQLKGKVTELEGKLAAEKYTKVTLEAGKVINISTGSSVIVVSGGMTVGAGQLIDISAGAVSEANMVINHQCVVSEDCKLTSAAEGQTVILIKGDYTNG